MNFNEVLNHITSLIDAVTAGNPTPQQLIDITLLIQSIFIFSYLISSLFLITNLYAGFNAGFLNILLISFTVYSYYILRVAISRVSYGMVLGGSVILMFILFQSAIFWGQYSGCIPSKLYKRFEIGCTNPSAMESLSAFSVLLFLSYIYFIWVLIKFKQELLGDLPSGYMMPSSYNNTRRGGYAPVPTSTTSYHNPVVRGSNSYLPISGVPQHQISRDDHVR